jgi:peroxiredoxin Q/BCP
MRQFGWACAVLAAAIVVSVSAAAQDEKAVELKVGDKAPAWDLKASDGKSYKLADFKGKQAVVLAFFPKAFTPGCTAQCKDLAAKNDKVDATGAAHFMISVDKEEDNARFAKEYGAAFPILADPTKETAKAYGVLMPQGFAKRVTFYIDKEGVIKAIENAKPVTAADDTVAKLIELGLAKAADPKK